MIKKQAIMEQKVNISEYKRMLIHRIAMLCDEKQKKINAYKAEKEANEKDK